MSYIHLKIDLNYYIILYEATKVLFIYISKNIALKNLFDVPPVQFMVSKKISDKRIF